MRCFVFTCHYQSLFKNGDVYRLKKGEEEEGRCWKKANKEPNKLKYCDNENQVCHKSQTTNLCISMQIQMRITHEQALLREGIRKVIGVGGLVQDNHIQIGKIVQDKQ